MLSTIQNEIDRFLSESHLRTVTDVIYYPLDEAVVILRKMGYKNVTVDVSDAASPSEVLEKVTANSAVY